MTTNNSINSRELIKTNNLSDLTNTTTARTNLGGDGMVIIKYCQDDYFSPTSAHYYWSGPTFY